MLGRGGRNEVDPGGSFFDFQFVAELAVKFESACGVVSRHDVEGAGKVGEVISHVVPSGWVEKQKPGARPGFREAENEGLG